MIGGDESSACGNLSKLLNLSSNSLLSLIFIYHQNIKVFFIHYVIQFNDLLIRAAIDQTFANG